MSQDDADDLTAGLEYESPLKPAEAATIALPPALVQEIQDDPELLTKLARGQLALVQDRMVRKVLNDVDVTAGALATVHDALVKVAGMGKNAPASGGGGAGPGFVINIIRSSRRGEGVTIEGKASPVPELSVRDADA